MVSKVFQQFTLSHSTECGVFLNNSRGHVLDDAVEEVEALVVIGLGGNKLLEDSEKSGLKGQKVLPCYDSVTNVKKLVTRGGKNNRFFNATQFSLERFRLDADKLLIGIKNK